MTTREAKRILRRVQSHLADVYSVMDLSTVAAYELIARLRESL